MKRSESIVATFMLNNMYKLHCNYRLFDCFGVASLGLYE